ncbi:MAG: DUF6044 family protein [Acetatifactor sp.]
MRTRIMAKCSKVCFFAGAAAVLVMLVPYLILGEDAIVTYHDQLDGEMIAYILQAKHLFQGTTLPEFLGGASKTALTMPAPACVLLFLTGNYFAALVSMQVLGSLCGYVGMYSLAKECTGCKWTAVVAGVLYAYLPFLPVYGLSQYGLPLLVFCLLQIKKGRYVKSSLCYVICYALTSSLVLIGFGVLGMLALWILWELICFRREKRLLTGKPSGKAALRLLSAWLIMLVIYILENFTLLKQMLGLGGENASREISHKAEYALSPAPFWKQLLKGLWQGGQHSEDMHMYFLAAAVLLVGLFCMAHKKISGTQKKLLTVMGACAGINLFVAVLSALWESAAGIALRKSLAALGAFQMNRLLWLAPCFWYLLLACTLAFAVCWCREAAGMQKVIAAVGTMAVAVALGVTGVTVLISSNLKPNIQKLRMPDYKAISYSDYYAVGVMEQVADFLTEYTGQAQKDYRVVSLGIDPAAAYYHGFYCLDGYSNNYSLEYKHRFRNIIWPELKKSDYLREYFDTWGNRCYLFTSECPGYYTMEKNTFYFNHYEIDLGGLRELGGSYIISAAYIVNAAEQGLTLLREEPFETEESYYRIFLYGLAEE